MTLPIEINYSNPAKPRGVVGGNPSIRKNTTFRFFSHDGPLQVQFIGSSPISGDPTALLADNTDFTATKTGNFPFRCFLTISGQQIALDPNTPGVTGGELEVGP